MEHMMMEPVGPEILGFSFGVFLMLSSGIFYIICSIIVWRKYKNQKNELVGALLAFLIYQSLNMIFMGIEMHTMNMVYSSLAALSVFVGSAYMLKFPLYSLSRGTRNSIFFLLLIVVLGLFAWFMLNSETRVERKKKQNTDSNPTSIFDGGSSSFQRNRIQVNVSDFESMFPELQSEYYGELKNLILTTNTQHIDQEEMINWGFEVQSQYSKKIEEMGKYCFNPEIDLSNKLINEIGAIIETEFNSSRGLFKFIKKKSPVETIYKELIGKNEQLKNKIGVLSQISKSIDSFKEEFDILTQKLILYISGATYIKNHIAEKYRNILETRILSMESVIVQCSVNKKQIDLVKQNIIEIISIIQDTITIEINNWYTNNIKK
jgi:hypothetical protein